jgi:SAM-dependent methyltransferase
MFERLLTSDIDDLKRRERARQDADRAYNDALTALDAALQRVPDMPHPPPPPDEQQITPLNERWAVIDGVPSPGGWRGRLARFVWHVVEPVFARQQAFNSALVDHINRNVPVERETRKAIESTLVVFRDQLTALATFQSHLIRYLQHITPYVDTKDREVAGLMLGLQGAISGVGDELLKRWESMIAREQRFEGRTAALTASHDELRTALASVQQATQTLKRELERSAHGAQGVDQHPEHPEHLVHPAHLDAYKYVGFEDHFRGSQDEIRRRLTEYVPLFSGARDVLDVGCGRGEFLDLLRSAGVAARGIDINAEMVEVCRARGLDAATGDALGWLERAGDGSVGGLFAAQVIEHLDPQYLLRLLDTAFHKLRPGSRLVLETINPACWFAFFESYIRDITHVRPIHPETLKYLLTASGFQQVEVRFRAPYPEHEKLQPVSGGGTEVADFVETLNANAEKLNRLLFTHLDYAAIAVRP